MWMKLKAAGTNMVKPGRNRIRTVPDKGPEDYAVGACKYWADCGLVMTCRNSD